MSDVKRRLDKLESKQANRPGWCTCGHKHVTIVEPWEEMPPETPPAICPDCGLPIPEDIVRFVYAKDWRAIP